MIFKKDFFKNFIEFRFDPKHFRFELNHEFLAVKLSRRHHKVKTKKAVNYYHKKQSHSSLTKQLSPVNFEEY